MVGIISLHFFPKRVAEIIRKGEPVLRKISHTLDELKQLLQLVPTKSILKSGLKNMIEHLEAADTVGRSCNFKFGTAETEITEDVPLPRDDTIVTGHSRKRSLPSQKGCEPSPKKSKSNSNNSNNRRIINDSYNHHNHHHHHHHGNCTITN